MWLTKLGIWIADAFLVEQGRLLLLRWRKFGLQFHRAHSFQDAGDIKIWLVLTLGWITVWYVLSIVLKPALEH